MIKHLLIALVASILTIASGTATSQGPDRDGVPDTPGTGAHPALKEIDPGLAGHVIYRPVDLAGLGETRLGVYVFGNGGCSDDAASSRLHLLEIASHGYVAISPGAIYNGPGKSERTGPGPSGPSGPPATRAEQLSEATDWILEENQRSGSRYYGRIDPAAIAVFGFSCGRVQALMIAVDPRIGTAVIMNQLRGSEEAGNAFLGASCGLCANPDWEFETRGFDRL
ncbi:MAG TPA: hypothetical protein VMR74_07265 [Gammaproteobacteria bacterium]|nr:hypothetical protein [Gammaproteobacteria bacterium]